MELVIVFGPPAVGKMTVGAELARLTGFKLFHNHMTVEPVLDIFEFGSEPFGRLVGEFRRRVIEEAVDAELPGLIFTFVWGLELEADRDVVASYVDIVESPGGRTTFVELCASREERLARNSGEFRLEEKRSKRNLEFARQNLNAMDDQYVMNTGDVPTVAEQLWAERPYLRIDNSDVPAPDAAHLIAEKLGLPLL
ncbi:MAG TPA: AAA family ATPase [Nocardioidaceae bacterium]|nr:AAA family ATPase [Nocardioidaceae bacterium]